MPGNAWLRMHSDDTQLWKTVFSCNRRTDKIADFDGCGNMLYFVCNERYDAKVVGRGEALERKVFSYFSFF